MKRAVSVSIGSSKRNKAVEVTLLGEKVSIERIGTDGDMEAAALKYKELDGTVDAFGVAAETWAPLSKENCIRFIRYKNSSVTLKNSCCGWRGSEEHT